MNSLSIVIPVFNRDLNVVRYVVNDMLNNGVDEVVLSNTGQAKSGITHPRILEVWQPLPIFYPGITRNMGAVVANGDIQVHAGADILLASGSWDEFRTLDDKTTGSAPCALLNARQTSEAMNGKRAFPASFNKTCTAAFGMTKRAAMEVLKGPFDWEMRKWGWVDVEVQKRARMLGLRHRALSIKILHLYHGSGCCTFSKSMRTAECKHNGQLMNAKTRGTGWWSGLPAKDSKRGDKTMLKVVRSMKPKSEDECLICGELDFYTIPNAVAYLKKVYDSLKPGKWLRITFNDMEKLGASWARSRANQKNSHGRVRLTFWTMAMMRKALTDVGFVGVLTSDDHIGRNVFGISTLIAQRPEPVIPPTSKDEPKAEPMAETSEQREPEKEDEVKPPTIKRRRGRPKKSA